MVELRAAACWGLPHAPRPDWRLAFGWEPWLDLKRVCGDGEGLCNALERALLKLFPFRDTPSLCRFLILEVRGFAV